MGEIADGGDAAVDNDGLARGPGTRFGRHIDGDAGDVTRLTKATKRCFLFAVIVAVRVLPNGPGEVRFD